MKKPLICLAAASLLVTGCKTPLSSSPAAPEPAQTAVTVTPEHTIVASAVPPALADEMQKLAAELTGAGGLATVGTGESKSLELALNKAKANGRRELARMLEARFETLEKEFSSETKIPFESLLLSGFNNAARTVKQQIAVSVAQTLKYESHGGSFTAYAVMALDPKVIADQLAKEKDLYTRLQTTKAFAALNQDVKTFAEFKAGQK